MKTKTLFFSILFCLSASANCPNVTIKMMNDEAVAWAKVTTIDVVKKISSDPYAEVPIEVTFKVLTTYKGKLEKKLHLSYVWILQEPGKFLFEKGKDYILAIKKDEKGKITLVNLDCGSWGLPIAREKELIDYLNMLSPQVPSSLP